MQPVAGNYYPVNGMLMIKEDLTKETAVLINDRSQGGTSLKPGQIEVMIQRRTLLDDARGVDEPLNEINQDGSGLR
jgi:hypothetical protein